MLVNGWQNVRETNNDKAIRTQIQYQPNEGTLLNWSTFLGNEMPDSQPWQPRFFNNFFAQVRLTDRTDAALIFDLGFQKKPGSGSFNAWYATSLYALHRITSRIRLAGRLEYYSDRRQVIVPTLSPNGFQTLGASINLDISPTERFMWRLEARGFRSRDRIYPSHSGMDRLSGFLVSSFAITID